MLYERVVAEITAIIQYLREEVLVGSVIHDDVGIVVVLDDAMESDDARMRGGDLVESNLADMELSPNWWPFLGMQEAFYSIGARIRTVYLHCPINYAVAANAQDLDKFEGVVINAPPELQPMRSL